MGVHQTKPDQVRHRSVTDELLSILEAVTLTVGQVLLTHRDLTEGLLDQNQTDRAKLKIDSLRKKIEDQREKLVQIRHVQQRKKELERIRRDHEKSSLPEQKNGSVPVINQQGKVVGWIQTVGRDRVNILDPKGRVVGREINGVTYDRRGQARGTGRQGLRVLGMSRRR